MSCESVNPRRTARVPLVILAGSDRRPGPVPPGAEGYHFVVGYKGAEIRVGERPLVEILLERIRHTSVFGETYLAGPRRVYEDLVDCPIIDTDSNISTNIRAAVEEVRARHGPDTRLAIISCDVLPSVEEIVDLAQELMTPDGQGSGGEGADEAAVALSLVRVEDDLGASAWKPKYRIRPGPDEEPLSLLPGHLAVARPSRIRTGLFHSLVRLAYQQRNRDYDERRRNILLRFVGTLIWRDFLNIFRLSPPTLTYSVLRHGLGAFLSWRRGELTLDGLASAIGAVLVRRRFFRRYREQCVRLVVTSHTSFARDIDTQEEMQELLESLEKKSRPTGERG